MLTNFIQELLNMMNNKPFTAMNCSNVIKRQVFVYHVTVTA